LHPVAFNLKIGNSDGWFFPVYTIKILLCPEPDFAFKPVLSFVRPFSAVHLPKKQG